MKKTLLLSSVACLFALNANAQLNNDHNMMWYGKEVAPYIGADYAYDYVKSKGDLKNLKKDFNSGIINMGVRTMKYGGLEAFYQHSANTKSFKHTDNPVKSRFYAYGADLHGYMPIGCHGFNIVGALGIANYNLKLKSQFGSEDKNRMGYRVGAGLQYDFTNHIAARLMGRYTYLGAKYFSHINEVTVGMRYSF